MDHSISVKRWLAKKGARLGVAAEGQVLSIRDEDEGPGLPVDQLEQVLRPFARLDQSRNRATGGAGLGLAIAMSIARLQGGTVELENRAEGGLSARLRLGDGLSAEP